jgi:hypothetical protein
VFAPISSVEVGNNQSDNHPALLETNRPLLGTYKNIFAGGGGNETTRRRLSVSRFLGGNVLIFPAAMISPDIESL